MMKHPNRSRRFPHRWSAGLCSQRKQSGTRLRGEEGAALVEFAFSVSVLFLVVFGFLWLCVVLFMYNTAAEAAREATRWASVRGTTSGTSGTCNNPNITECPATNPQIVSYAQSLVGASGMTVQAWWCDSTGANCVTAQSSATPGNIVKVQVTYSLASIPLITNTAYGVSSTSEMVIWQ
jgi:Flp pilus assembly protein TadG